MCVCVCVCVCPTELYTKLVYSSVVCSGLSVQKIGCACLGAYVCVMSECVHTKARVI